MFEFKLPSMGSDMDEGKLLEWKVKPGDPVKKGDVVAIVDTAKSAVDVEIWSDGTVHALITQPGETIPVGRVMALLLEPGESAEQAAPVPAAAPPHPPTAGRRRVSPAARKHAAELGVDVEALSGTGPDGAVTVEDVEAAARQRPVEDKALAMRQAIAAAMARSKREIPHYYLAEPIPLVAAGAWLAARNADRPVTGRLLMAALFLKAVALAAKKYPEVNGFYRDGDFRPSAAVHVGVAISLRAGGLIAPALLDCETKGLDELMAGLADLVKRARAGSLRSSEMSAPSITVTNLGDQGVEAVHGVIYPPQVALVGFGRVEDRPWVQGGELRVAPVVTASLAADHRVSDGHRGALFLVALRELLQEPERL